MTAILTLIYCWLQEFLFSLTDWGLGIWDSLLSVADSTLSTIGTAGLTLPVIPDHYAWVLGATGMSQALAIVASAMGTRFILQTIPFVGGAHEPAGDGLGLCVDRRLSPLDLGLHQEPPMIELYEGVPGSGKSYHAICEKFLPWVRQGRRLYIAVDGIYLDRLSLFTGIELPVLEQQITIWKDSVEVLQAFPHVEPGSAVIIDEAQTVFRSMQKVEPGLLRWLETHRHYGVDILLMSQDFRQMSQGVTRLIEATVKFRKLAFVGLSKKYQGKVRGNPEDNEVIRAFVGTYSPAIYAYYSSYASAAIREEKRSHTVFKSARVAIGIAAGLFAIGLMVWRPWSSLSDTKGTTGTGVSSTAPLPPLPSASAPGSLLNPFGASVSSAAIPPPPRRSVRILGGAGSSANRQGWRYLLDSGEILTAAQITGRYGLVVSEVYEDGSMRLIGEGVFYGPAGD